MMEEESSEMDGWRVIDDLRPARQVLGILLGVVVVEMSKSDMEGSRAIAERGGEGGWSTTTTEMEATAAAFISWSWWVRPSFVLW